MLLQFYAITKYYSHEKYARMLLFLILTYFIRNIKRGYLNKYFIIFYREVFFFFTKMSKKK